MSENHKNNNSYGFGLVEVIFSAAVISASIGLIFTASVFSERSIANATVRNQITLLLIQGAEAMRYLRSTHVADNATWNNFFDDAGLSPKCLTDAPTVIDGACPKIKASDTLPNYYERTVQTYCAERHSTTKNITGWVPFSTGNCDDGAGPMDPDTVKAIISVKWTDRNGIPKEETLETVVTKR